MTTAIVIVRDRLTYAQQCISALQSAGADVHIVDHGSTYPPLLEWYKSTNVAVHRRPNAHPRSLWDWNGFPEIVKDGRYIVTDPDVVPDEKCPADWLSYLHTVLDEWPGWVKAGLSLRIDDLPAHYRHADRVPIWESQWWEVEITPQLFNAGVDTTMALYRSLDENKRFAIHPSLRTNQPYIARHLTWYQDSSNLTEEEAYYYAHVENLISHWADPDAYTRQ